MPTFVPEFCKVEFTTMSESINHPGIVERIDNHLVSVRITQYSACAGCHAKSACTAADKKDKIVVIEDYSGEYQKGDSVWIVGQNSLGMQAVFIAFGIPVILLLIALLVGTTCGISETANGLATLCVLAVYYLILYKFRDKLKKHFVFKLKKI